jgi:hypothetical protein
MRMQKAPKAKTVAFTARLTGFENEEHAHRAASFLLVREVPSSSRFTHQASGSGGGFACAKSGCVPRDAPTIPCQLGRCSMRRCKQGPCAPSPPSRASILPPQRVQGHAAAHQPGQRRHQVAGFVERRRPSSTNEEGLSAAMSVSPRSRSIAKPTSCTTTDWAVHSSWRQSR